MPQARTLSKAASSQSVASGATPTDQKPPRRCSASELAEARNKLAKPSERPKAAVRGPKVQAAATDMREVVGRAIASRRRQGWRDDDTGEHSMSFN